MTKLIPILFFIGACAGNSAVVDGGPAVDSSGTTSDGGAMCGTQACGAGDSCCVTNYSSNSGPVSWACGASCEAPAITVACNAAADCGGDPCCIKTANGQVTAVACGASPGDCEPTFGGGMGKTHTCATNADCASSDGNVYTDCCHSTAGVMIHLCFSKDLVSLANGTIACP